ncbi:MAG: hypothetical protein WCT26_04855 [Candidatus Buchananbacteria bacterium]
MAKKGELMMEKNVYLFSDGPNFWVIPEYNLARAWRKLFNEFRLAVKMGGSNELRDKIFTNSEIKRRVDFHVTLVKGQIFPKGKKKNGISVDSYANLVFGAIGD